VFGTRTDGIVRDANRPFSPLIHEEVMAGPACIRLGTPGCRLLGRTVPDRLGCIRGIVPAVLSVLLTVAASLVVPAGGSG